MRTKMQMITVMVNLLMVGCAWSARAQSVMDESQEIQSVWHKEKKAIVQEYMKLNTAEDSKFWPVYDAYMVERTHLAHDRIAILSEYVNNYSSLTDEKAETLTNWIFDNDLQLTKLEKKYYGKFKKAISAYKASQFMQLESYLQTTIRSEIQDAIPFIGELEKVKSN